MMVVVAMYVLASVCLPGKDGGWGGIGCGGVGMGVGVAVWWWGWGGGEGGGAGVGVDVWVCGLRRALGRLPRRPPSKPPENPKKAKKVEVAHGRPAQADTRPGGPSRRRALGRHPRMLAAASTRR